MPRQGRGGSLSSVPSLERRFLGIIGAKFATKEAAI